MERSKFKRLLCHHLGLGLSFLLIWYTRLSTRGAVVEIVYQISLEAYLFIFVRDICMYVSILCLFLIWRYCFEGVFYQCWFDPVKLTELSSVLWLIFHLVVRQTVETEIWKSRNVVVTLFLFEVLFLLYIYCYSVACCMFTEGCHVFFMHSLLSLCNSFFDPDNYFVLKSILPNVNVIITLLFWIMFTWHF